MANLRVDDPEIFKEFSNDANFVATMIDMLNKKYRSK